MSNSKISINVEGDVSVIGINNDAWTVDTMKDFNEARYANVKIDIAENVIPKD